LLESAHGAQFAVVVAKVRVVLGNKMPSMASKTPRPPKPAAAQPAPMPPAALTPTFQPISAMNSTLGPGAACARAMLLVNCASVSQWRSSTR
jgi:hypothetical protein